MCKEIRHFESSFREEIFTISNDLLIFANYKQDFEEIQPDLAEITISIVYHQVWIRSEI